MQLVRFLVTFSVPIQPAVFMVPKIVICFFASFHAKWLSTTADNRPRGCQVHPGEAVKQASHGVLEFSVLSTTCIFRPVSLRWYSALTASAKAFSPGLGVKGVVVVVVVVPAPGAVVVVVAELPPPQPCRMNAMLMWMAASAASRTFDTPMAQAQTKPVKWRG